MCIVLWSKCPGCCPDKSDPELVLLQTIWCKAKLIAQQQDRASVTPFCDPDVFYPCSESETCKWNLLLSAIVCFGSWFARATLPHEAIWVTGLMNGQETLYNPLC